MSAVADLALLTPGASSDAVSVVLPSLELLPHHVRVLDLDPATLLHEPAPDLVLIDATTALAPARNTIRTLVAMELGHPLIAILTEGGLAALSPDWPVADFLLSGASPAEITARLQRARSASAPGPDPDSGPGHDPGTGLLQAADVVVDEASWTVRAGGEALNLTFKEFELLSYLIGHPGRVVTREQLLHEVWGTDYYGGPRTVDVHIRRLRAKLGPERESLIGTIRNVGYRFAGPGQDRSRDTAQAPPRDTAQAPPQGPPQDPS